jgi:hypothetical protein
MTTTIQVKSPPTLNELRDAVHDNAVSKGWWPDGGRNFGEMMMLIVTELAEAMEEARRPGFDPKLVWMIARGEKCSTCSGTGVMPAYKYDPTCGSLGACGTCHGRGRMPPVPGATEPYDPESSAKPEGFGVEMADVAIRTFDVAGAQKMDLHLALFEHSANLMPGIVKGQTMGALLAATRATSDPLSDNTGDQLLRVTGAIVRTRAIWDTNHANLPGAMLVILGETLLIADKHGINLDDAIRIKMSYNSTRPMRHGGKLA